MRSGCTFLAIIVALIFWRGPVSAQEQAFGDWAKQCEPTPDGDERCYLIQTVMSDDGPIMWVIVAYSPGRKRVAAMIDVPLGMHIPSGLEFRAPGVVKRIEFEQCLPTGCRALLPIDDALLAALKTGEPVAVAGRSQNGGNVELPLSGAGFSEAFEAL